MGGSKLICNSIRSNAKTTLQRKFEELLSKSRTMASRRCRNTVDEDQRSHRMVNNVPERSRVTVLGGIALPEGARSLLELGPSFSPAEPISKVILRKIACSLHELQDRLRGKARLETLNTNEREAGTLPLPPFPRPFFRQQDPNNEIDNKFRIFSEKTFKTLNQYLARSLRSNLTETRKRGMREVRELIKSKAIRVSVSDKGGEFVIIPRQLDVAITEKHLQDASLYRPSTEKEFKTQYRKLNREWVKEAKAAGLKPSVIYQLKLELPTCPVLYLLIKTHKLMSTDDLSSTDPSLFKVRPIISCVDGPTDRITWFLTLIFTQLLKHIPAHLTNTQMFLDRLRNASPNSAYVMESFDVTALYTNVSNDSAIQAINELLIQHEGSINMYGFSIRQLMALLKECLNCSIFRWSGRYYAQMRGLAMGQRLAPSLAIAFMSKVEAPVIDLRPLLYCRYIDDCFVICSTQEEMDKCFELLNEQSEYIRFTREKPKENWLPFLNVQIKLSENGYVTKWYRKPSNKNIIVHCLSSHPSHTKRAIVKSMFRTATNVCTGGEQKEESLALAREIAISNGYKAVASRDRFRGRTMPPNDLSSENKVPFILPFISNEITTAIKRCLRRAGLDNSVRVIEIPPNTLRRQLVRNRLYDRLCETKNCVVCPNGRDGDCMISGTVYRISCKTCGYEYIGETGRPLCVRIREHLVGKVKAKQDSPLGAHRTQRHSGEDFEVEVGILAQECNTSARKTLEAFWINSKNPKMNRREECIIITRDLGKHLKQLF